MSKEFKCPDCGRTITGPSYPKLHTCNPKDVISYLRAELATHRWIPVSDMPENLRERPTTEAWETYYFILEESSAMPQVMRADEIWLNENLDVEYYLPLPLLPQETG